MRPDANALMARMLADLFPLIDTQCFVGQRRVNQLDLRTI